MFPRILAVLFAALLATSACGDSAPDAGTQAGGVAIADAWVKASDMEMSAAFAVLSNSGDEDAVVTGVAADVTGDAELHETVDGSMRQVESFTIPAGGSFSLEPGGNHIMLLGLGDPIEPGQEIDFTLTFDDGSTFDFSAPAKDFDGADEDYDKEH